jgi:4-hydroxy-tetrahydrodipicolinate synthase
VSGPFTGLSAFPLTPVLDGGTGGVDEASYGALVARAAEAGVDSVTVLGSTGSGAYLDRDERRRAIGVAVQAAAGVPVLAGVGALRTRDVLRHVDDAQAAGVQGLLLAPMSYQPLTDDEVHDLYADVTAAASVPVVVYDNPGTTRVVFSDALHARIAALPGIAAVKIPPVAGSVEAVRARVSALRAVLPDHVAIGCSGDGAAAVALLAGCEGWWSALAGTLPGPCREITDAARAGDEARALRLSGRLQPLWDLFGEAGSLRVVAAVAEELGLVAAPHLPRPVQGLGPAHRARVRAALAALDL